MDRWCKRLPVFFVIIIACLLWKVGAPKGLDEKAWHLAIIFMTTIISIILNPMPMGAIAIFSLLVSVLTKTLTLEEGLSGFSDTIIWLVLLSFFMSQGFIKTGLGERIAYNMILRYGKTTLGLSYALVIVDFLLSPFIPSVCARGGGIIFPITKSLCTTYSSNPRNSSSHTSGFLMKVCMQSNVITSTMFITAMAANPLAVKFAANMGIIISWGDWARAAILPGIISLISMPLIVYYLYPPSVKRDLSATTLARGKLDALGSISLQEIIMLATFVLLIFLWIFGTYWDISATTVSLLGLSVLLLTKVIKADDILSDKAAWHTFIWYAILVMLSGFTSQFGLISWVSDILKATLFLHFSTTIAVVILGFIYFYIHYFCASITTHIAILFPTFLMLFLHANMPALLSALLLSFLSILSSCLTHYGISSAPIYFGTGYMKARTWWYIGLILSFAYALIWIGIGGIWWKFLGLW